MGAIKTYTRYSWYADKVQKKNTQVFILVIVWVVLLEETKAFLISSKGAIKKIFGKPCLKRSTSSKTGIWGTWWSRCLSFQQSHSHRPKRAVLGNAHWISLPACRTCPKPPLRPQWSVVRLPLSYPSKQDPSHLPRCFPRTFCEQWNVNFVLQISKNCVFFFRVFQTLFDKLTISPLF